MDLIAHMRRAMAFSVATWGPKDRQKGVADHIRKELDEIVDAPDDGKPSKEWTDVVILGLDGLWRALRAEGLEWDEIPEKAAQLIAEKQSTNEQRDWPDWREMSSDEAIEHVRKNYVFVTARSVTVHDFNHHGLTGIHQVSEHGCRTNRGYVSFIRAERTSPMNGIGVHRGKDGYFVDRESQNHPDVIEWVAALEASGIRAAALEAKTGQ